MNELNEIARSLIPVRMEVAWGTVTGVTGTMVTLLFGEWNNALQALAMFIFLDYVTGVMAAYVKPRSGLSSKKGLKGIVKKLALVAAVAFAHWLDIALGQTVFCPLATYSLIGNEGISIIENLAHCGVPVPEAISKKLEQLAHEKEEKGGGSNGNAKL